MTSLKTFSFGGGVQSTAALVLAAQRKIDFPIFLFANVGDDSEKPETLSYVHEYAREYARKNEIEFYELRKAFVRGKRAGETETIYQRVMGENRSICIPAYMGGGGGAGSRACTSDFKIKVIERWQRLHGATRDNPAITGLGISSDEPQRMKTDSGSDYQILNYPLIDLNLSRKDCIKIIESAGLPVPPKSACWFCPFTKHSEWIRMRNNDPELFARAVALEQRLNEKRNASGDDVARLHRSLPPIDVAVQKQLEFQFDEDVCDAGFCFT